MVMKVTEHLPAWMEDAIWSGDVETLSRRVPCGCCCEEHTRDDCPARAWHGCRGQGTLTRAEIEEWAKHYGMTMSEFYGLGISGGR